MTPLKEQTCFHMLLLTYVIPLKFYRLLLTCILPERRVTESFPLDLDPSTSSCWHSPHTSHPTFPIPSPQQLVARLTQRTRLLLNVAHTKINKYTLVIDLHEGKELSYRCCKCVQFIKLIYG